MTSTNHRPQQRPITGKFPRPKTGAGGAQHPQPPSSSRGGGIDARIPRWRAAAVFALLALCLFGLALKAGRLQLLLGDDLRDLAENQYLRTVQVAAPRGDITDRKGRPLAVSVAAWSVGARPALVEDKAAAAQALAPVLGMSAAEIAQKWSAKGKKDAPPKFVWLARRASLDVADGVRALGIPGIELRQDTRRVWPQKTAAGQLLGLVDIDGKAAGGVEQAFDDALQGRSQTADALADNKGDRIAVGDGIDLSLLDGDTVALTIDLGIQHESDDALRSAVVEHSAKAGWSITMDAKSGAILAVSNYPELNPNAPDVSVARNNAVAEAFEPGSIFKIATFAAALEAGVVKPDDKIFCENGRYQLGKHVIHDTHKSGWLTAVEVFQESSNIGTLKIAERLGEEPMKQALVRFGFGERPGTGLIGETAGRLPPQGRWGEARLATVSFGHGIMVSALQMVSLAQAVANGGVKKAPHLLARVTTSTGEVVREGPDEEGERVMSAATARTLTEIMKTVSQDGGTGTLAAIPGIEVAGKTGTAEKVDPVTHRYSDELHLSSFVGFAPADDPRVVSIVVLDEPQGRAHFGGLVAAPAWRRIIERALVEDNVLAQARLDEIGKQQAPAAGARLAKAARSAAEGSLVDDLGAENKSGVSTPRTTAESLAAGSLDLRGMTARAALREAERAGVDVEMSGSGVVVSQAPAPGKKLEEGTRVKLVLAEAAPAPGGRAR